MTESEGCDAIAIYHCSVKIASRGKVKSAVSAAAMLVYAAVSVKTDKGLAGTPANKIYKNILGAFPPGTSASKPLAFYIVVCPQALCYNQTMKIITGAAASGKTTEILKRIAALPKDEKSMLIVPGQYTYHMERKLLDTLGVNACANQQVCSPERLAYMIAANGPLSRKKVISKEAKALVTRYITDTSAPSLGLYRFSAFKKGFADDVSVLISEMLRDSLSPKQLEEAAERTQSDILKRKLTDVSVLYKEYFSAINSSYIDPDRFLDEAAQYAESCEFIKQTHFFYDSFYTLDQADISLIAALEKHSLGVTVSLCYENDAFYSLTHETLEQLKECGGNVEIIPIKARGSEGALAHLKQNFISPAAYKQSKELTAEENTKGQVILYEAPDIREEVRYVASEITRLTRECGLRYRDIAVSCPQPESYSPYINDIFSDYNIPFFTDVRRRIVYTAPIRAFIFLLAGEGGGAEDILAYAKCGFTEATAEECETAENYALEFGIKAEMFTEPFTRNNEKETYDLTEVNAIREKIISPIAAFERSVAKAQNVAQWCEYVYAFLRNEGFEERISRMYESFKKEGDYENANIYAQIYNKLIEILEALHELFGSLEVDKKLLYRMVSYSLASSDVGVIPSVIDKVSVGDVLRSRAGDIKIFFVLGATEGLLSSAHTSAAILTDKDKNSLNACGVKLVNTAEYRKKKEDFILYTLMCLPSEKLYVSRFRYADGDDGKLPEAEMFETLKEMFGDVSPVLPPQRLYSSVKSAFDALCTDMSERKYNPTRDKTDDAYFNMLGEYFKNTPSLNAYEQSANAAVSYTNEAVLKPSEAQRSALTPSSVSRLERYAQCPFSYFMEYVIRPKERAVHTVRTADTGSVLHKIIEVFSRMLIDGKIDAEKATEQEIAVCVGEICEEELSNYRMGIYKTLAQSKYLKNKLIQTAVKAACEICSQLKLSDFLLMQTEASFSDKGAYMPIIIDGDDGTQVVLSGKIDRIDACEINGKKYVKIIDYKSGSTDFNLTKTYYGLSLQLPVYVCAALSGNEKALPAGVFYLHLKQSEVDIKKSDDFASIKKNVRKVFKLSGIALKDIKVMRALDKGCDTDSFIEGVSIKDGQFAKDDNLVSEEVFFALIEHTKENIKKLVSSACGGDISIRPYKFQNQIPCGSDYFKCSYASICKFSTQFAANRYNRVYPLDTANISSVFSAEEEKSR